MLCDEHSMTWAVAWEICKKTFSYTNHTLMPEALETWPVALMQHVLPRHLEIIFRINAEFLEAAAKFRPGDGGFLARLSLIDEGGERRVRMANLSIVGSHKVNGVLGATLGPAGANHLLRLRCAVAGPLHEYDKWGDAAPLAFASQSRLGRPARQDHRVELAHASERAQAD